MFYILSKVLFFFTKPSNVVWLLMLAGLLVYWRGWHRQGLRLIVIGLALLLVVGFSPLGSIIIYPLEQRFARSQEDVAAPARLGHIDGIIVLGGFEDGRSTRAGGLLSLNEAAERLTEAVRLAHALPTAKIIFTGGIANLILSDEDAALAIGSYFTSVGIEKSRVVLEDKSRNTWENAVFTRDTLGPVAGRRFLLVTSAFHMPRSVGVFRKAGFDVIVWPVDFRTAGVADFYRPLPQIYDGLQRVDTAVKEWFGLVAYYLTGRSTAIWPAP